MSDVPDPRRHRPTPPLWKVTVLTFLGLYPPLLLVLGLLGPALVFLPFAIRTAVVAAVLVPLMVYVVMPALTGAFRTWLQSEASPDVPPR